MNGSDKELFQGYVFFFEFDKLIGILAKNLNRDYRALGWNEEKREKIKEGRRVFPSEHDEEF